MRFALAVLVGCFLALNGYMDVWCLVDPGLGVCKW